MTPSPHLDPLQTRSETLHLRLLGLLGLVAALGVGTGEFLVHFTHRVPEPGVPFGYLRHVPIPRLTLGHGLIVVFMPLYFAGYRHLALAVRPAGERRATALWILGVIALCVGGMWVGSRALLGHLAHHLDAPGLESRWDAVAASYQLLMENLLWVLRAVMAAISIIFAWCVLGGRTFYPRWVVLLSPAFQAAIFLASPVAWPAAGALLVPAAMNLAHSLLFAGSLLALSRRSRHHDSYGERP